MKTVSVVVFYIVMLIFLAMISLVVYTFVYNRRIARNFNMGKVSGKQWPAPKNIVLIVLVVFLTIFCLLNIISKNENNQTDTLVNQNMSYISYTSDEIEGTYAENYVEAFLEGELSGYRKVEKTEDDFHYMYFISEQGYDILHPSFILFVEYIGENEYKGYMDKSTIYINEDNNYGSSSGNEVAEFYCVIGNINFEENAGFSYELALYEDTNEMKMDFEDEKLQKAEKKIEIWISD